MKIGDIVEDEWGEIAIIIGQIGVTDRWHLKYVATGDLASAWGSKLYPLG